MQDLHNSIKMLNASFHTWTVLSIPFQGFLEVVPDLVTMSPESQAYKM